MLTTNLQLALSLRMNGATPPLPLYVFIACRETILPFYMWGKKQPRLLYDNRKLIFKTLGVAVWNGFIWFRTMTNGGFLWNVGMRSVGNVSTILVMVGSRWGLHNRPATKAPSQLRLQATGRLNAHRILNLVSRLLLQKLLIDSKPLCACVRFRREVKSLQLVPPVASVVLTS
jgi:hypothetical protein